MVILFYRKFLKVHTYIGELIRLFIRGDLVYFQVDFYRKF
jgi:hypothetical protein